MKNKFIIFLFLSLFLFSCWDEENITSSWLIKFENNEFSINIPSTWTIIKNNDNILPKPKVWNIDLAVSSDELRFWFSNNLLILSQTLNKKINSLDFSILNNVWSSREFLEYTKLESKTFDFNNQDKSQIYVFEAKYNTSTPKLKYIQVGKVCINKWYLLTIALSTDIKDNSIYEDILKTFECR